MLRQNGQTTDPTDWLVISGSKHQRKDKKEEERQSKGFSISLHFPLLKQFVKHRCKCLAPTLTYIAVTTHFYSCTHTVSAYQASRFQKKTVKDSSVDGIGIILFEFYIINVETHLKLLEYSSLTVDEINSICMHSHGSADRYYCTQLPPYVLIHALKGRRWSFNLQPDVRRH